MAYQVPKKDHPWRTGHMIDSSTPVVKKPTGKALKVFIQEIAQNWDEVSVVTTTSSGLGEYTLGELSQEKQAAWLAGVLKRNYARQF